MVVTKEEIMKQLSLVLSIVPQKYIDTLLTLHAKLDGKDIEWAIGGDLGEMLRTINVDPNGVDILTSKGEVERIAEAVKEFNPSKITFKIQQLQRNARVRETEYPIYTRSHYSDFNIETIKVKVYGDLQYRVDSWDWGDTMEFTPEYVSVVGKKIAVVPLSLKYELYRMLGWTDRAEKIKQALDRRNQHKR